jgi:hypothetical protein
MMKTALFAFPLLWMGGQFLVSGQVVSDNRDRYRLSINKTDDEFNIDGVLDEPTWSQAETAGSFHRILPIDTGYAQAQTEVKLCYDESNIYMGIICHDTLPGKRPVESLRRDFSFGLNDNFIAFIDTYNDRTNGFAFGISAAGAQWDGMQANGGFVSLDWDCKWKSAVTNHPGCWIAEFSIPFRSIRYRGEDKSWGINFSRMDLKSNEKSSWAPVPRQFQSANLAYTGTLVWDHPLPASGVRFSLIPYVSGKALQDNEAGESVRYKWGAGLDAKVILSTSLNLDITINPDYSQVEVDRQQTNLDRFELFYPEKRQFFLENSDLFAELGSENNRPFFSRRIGLDSPVLAGARLSGTVGDNWRIGLMNVQTGMKDTIPANNHTVVALQRQVLARSNIVAFMTNKQVTTDQERLEDGGLRFNRVAGMEFNLASDDNRLTGKAYYHHSFYPEAKGDRFTTAAEVAYNTQQFSAELNQAYVGGDYIAEMGYIRRTGYYQIKPQIGYKFFPVSEHVANHGPTLDIEGFFTPDLSLTDHQIELGYAVEWMNRSNLSLELENGYVKLLEPFDPTHTGGDTLARGSEFRWNELALSYTSDTRKLFNFMFDTRYGGFFNGTRLSLDAELNFRVQPYGSLSMTASYDRILLPKPYASADLVLVGPRLDITFTDKLFFTTFVQYNNQIDNINVNTRFQWRFAPVSDLFIVYTENAYPVGLVSKNRGLVIKLSYWIN